MVITQVLALNHRGNGPTPKSLKAIDIDFTGGKALVVIHFEVAITTKH